MKCNITEQLDEIAVKLGAEKADSENIVEALEKIRVAVNNGGGGGSSSVTDWPLADRMAKGVDGDGNEVTGAIIEGCITGNNKNVASAHDTHAEGNGTKASGPMSHAEGGGTIASGYYSHAEGGTTKAQGNASHAEGGQTTASGDSAHAEGQNTIASAGGAHAEGGQTTASGVFSHAEGGGTTAARACQHVFGAYNIAETGNGNEKGTYVEIVGNGERVNGVATRSNARTLDWEGNEKLAGGLTLGMGTADEVTITAAQLKELLLLLN